MNHCLLQILNTGALILTSTLSTSAFSTLDLLVNHLTSESSALHDCGRADLLLFKLLHDFKGDICFK